MKPQFSEAAKRVANEKLGLLAAVDSTVNEALSRKFSIQGFPTIKYFENGVFKADYEGKRTADDLYGFVKNGGAGGKSTGKDEL